MKKETRIWQRTWAVMMASIALFFCFAAPCCPTFISPTSASYPHEGITSDKVKVTTPSTCNWTATSNDSWITIISGSSGTGNGVVIYSVSANLGSGSRQGTMTIALRTFTVTQTSACRFSISPTSARYSLDGTTSDQVKVTANKSDCAWAATSNDSWITIISGGSGTGNGVVIYSVSANPGSGSRQGTMTIAGHVFTVLQTGVNASFFVSYVAPASGPPTGGTGITIQGGGFQIGASVAIGGNPATVLSVAENRITGTTGRASTSGIYDVVVTNPGGEFAVLHRGFTYRSSEASFFVSYVAPASGPLTGGTSITIEGRGFQIGASVTIAGNPATVTGVTKNEITATTGGASTPGTYDVIVTNPGGDSAVRHDGFTYLPATEQEELFVPIVVSSAGLSSSFFTSEMTLTNRGSGDVTVDFTYRSSTGTGSGTATDSLAPGQQKFVPDVINYLGSLGVPIPTSGDQGGTLKVAFLGLSSSSDAGVTVRTTTVVPEGRAGLAYAGIPVSMALTGPSYIVGLRQNQADRSNLAIQNVGGDSDGPITLRLTVFSGEGNDATPHVLPDQVLAPGGWAQISGILVSNPLSLSQGYVRIEPISGTARYYAYGVINDQANSDGSFVPPILESTMMGRAGLTLPVIVETSAFSSELVLGNWSTEPKTLHFFYAGDALQSQGSAAHFDLVVNAREQRIIPNLVEWIREQNGSGMGPAGPSYAGPLFATIEQGDLDGIFMGARTSTPGGGGEYGVFYAATPYGAASTTDAWLYSLRQDDENRTNLAIVNSGEADGSPDTFDIELFDGDIGTKANTVRGITVNARRWFQIDRILGRYAPEHRQGYAHIIRTSGSNPFITYAVNNDGAKPHERSDDGSFIASSP